MSGIDLIPTDLIQAGNGILRSEIYKLTTSIWNKEELLQQQKVQIIVFIYNKSNNTDCINY